MDTTWRIQTLYKVPPDALSLFDTKRYEVGPRVKRPHGILARSAELENLSIPEYENLRLIMRAGEGTEKINKPQATRLGIFVANTPGKNTQSVVQLTGIAIGACARNVGPALAYSRSLPSLARETGRTLKSLVEDEKWRFQGTELENKILCVIGLGKIGASVANDAIKHDMQVVGYDPLLTLKKKKKGLHPKVQIASCIEEALSGADFVTIHVPLLKGVNEGLIGKIHPLSLLKPGCSVINYARGGLVDNAAMLMALNDETVSVYWTDFPHEAGEVIGHPRMFGTTHLGASTLQCEKRCAMAGVKEMIEFFEFGFVGHPVNFRPFRDIPVGIASRLSMVNDNVEGLINEVTATLRKWGVNIDGTYNKANEAEGQVAYTVFDFEKPLPAGICEEIENLSGIKWVRELRFPK